MFTIAVMIFAAKMGVGVKGVGGFIICDIILAWIVVNGLVKILGGA